MGSILITGAVDIAEFCNSTKEILAFIGWVLTVFKIAIPILIIALGMFDLGKAVVASKEDEIKKQTKRLLYRALAGVLIFFVPTIVMFLFESVNNYNTTITEAKGAFDVCTNCILQPWGCK